MSGRPHKSERALKKRRRTEVPRRRIVDLNSVSLSREVDVRDLIH